MIHIGYLTIRFSSVFERYNTRKSKKNIYFKNILLLIWIGYEREMGHQAWELRVPLVSGKDRLARDFHPSNESNDSNTLNYSARDLI